MKFDVMTLATILSEEFERDSWGDIEPELFANVAEYAEALAAGKHAIVSPDEDDLNTDNDYDLDDLNEEDQQYVIDLHAVLTRVVARLNAESVKE